MFKRKIRQKSQGRVLDSIDIQIDHSIKTLSEIIKSKSHDGEKGLPDSVP